MEVMESILAREKKAEPFKRRLRLKGKVTAKGMTKNNNISLTVEKNKEEHKFTILRSHKERYAIAERTRVGQSVSIDGIPKPRWIICTRLKILEKGIAKGRQEKLDGFLSREQTHIDETRPPAKKP